MFTPLTSHAHLRGAGPPGDAHAGLRLRACTGRDLERAARDLDLAVGGRHRLSADEHLGLGRGDGCASLMRALHHCSHVEQATWHERPPFYFWIKSAPLLMSVTPLIWILGAVIVTPSGPTTIVDWPLFSTMPDVVRGEAGPSQIWTRFCSVVCRRMCATGGLGSTAADGTVPVSQKPPLQIGLLASPSSNSTQTLACGGATM